MLDICFQVFLVVCAFGSHCLGFRLRYVVLDRYFSVTVVFKGLLWFFTGGFLRHFFTIFVVLESLLYLVLFGGGKMSFFVYGFRVVDYEFCCCPF